MKRLKNILQSKLFIILLIFFISILSIYCIKNDNIVYKDTITGIVKNIIKTDTKTNIYINDVLVTTYSNIDLRIGYLITIKGKISLPSNNTNFNLFNYRNYLKGNGIKYIINLEEYQILSSTPNILYRLKNKIINIINSSPNKSYLKAFLLGDKTDIDDTTKTSFIDNGISHLFAISGMHVSLLSCLILYVLNRIKKQDINYIIVFILLLIYSFLVNNTPSILRAVLFFLLTFINKKTINLSNHILLFYLFIIFIIIYPFYIYNISFIYSFTISFFLIKYGIITNNKPYFIKLLLTSFIAFISSIPISINNYYSLNLVSIINNLIFVPLVSFIIFPLSLLTFIFPFLNPLFNITTNILEYLSIFISNFNINIILCHIPWHIVIIYYIIIIFILEKLKQNNYKYLILIYIILLIHSNIPHLSNSVHYLDVGQGDSILLIINNKSYLIDTGGKYNYNISSNILIPYLKSYGIKKLDHLILTHGDYDHMGEAINLVNNFKVEKVIFNCGEYNDLEQELIKVLDKKKIKYYSCIKELNIDKNRLYFLQTQEYDNENDNSNVIYTELNGYKFMFMGDASSTTEREILDKYTLPDIDVLKVGHHGSKTSSSKEFIDEINPKYSVISVGKKNRYGHPNKEVLNNLNNSKIYRTDEDGSIEIKLNKSGYKIRTCSP